MTSYSISDFQAKRADVKKSSNGKHEHARRVTESL